MKCGKLSLLGQQRLDGFRRDDSGNVAGRFAGGFRMPRGIVRRRDLDLARCGLRRLVLGIDNVR